jgi:hypothetical protein
MMHQTEAPKRIEQCSEQEASEPASATDEDLIKISAMEEVCK